MIKNKMRISVWTFAFIFTFCNTAYTVPYDDVITGEEVAFGLYYSRNSKNYNAEKRDEQISSYQQEKTRTLRTRTFLNNAKSYNEEYLRCGGSQNLYDEKRIRINALIEADPTLAEIDTENRFKIISKSGFILFPRDLSFTNFIENRNFEDFYFKFIIDGANSYRISNAQAPQVMNVTHGKMGSYGDKDVQMNSDDGTWKEDRAFLPRRNEEGYYRFINETSSTLLEIDLNAKKIRAFYCSNLDIQEDNKLFRIERVEEEKKLPWISFPAAEEKIENISVLGYHPFKKK